MYKYIMTCIMWMTCLSKRILEEIIVTLENCTLTITQWFGSLFICRTAFKLSADIDTL